jgi:hypothetical protein
VNRILRYLLPAGVLALLASLALWWLLPAPVTGQLVEYHGEAPVAGATITVRRQGWGRSDHDGKLTWNKGYVATATTNTKGRFRVPTPGPVWLVGSGGGRLTAEAEGFHTLNVGYVPPGAKLHLQTVANHAERLPGGTAILGWNEIGEPFGWSFIDHAPTRDLALADLYPLRLSRQPFEVILAVPDGGGLHFVASEAQGVTTPSQDYLLRYLDASPEPTTASRLSLGDTPGTIFLRTPQGRHAKLAWEPGTVMSMSGHVHGLEASSKQMLSLRFVYRPGPGHVLPYQPPLLRIDPVRAGLLATLPQGGPPEKGPRTYQLVVTDGAGRELERQRVELAPGSPLDLPSCAVAAPLVWRFQALRLEYDEEDLPRLAMMLKGERSAYHAMPQLVGSRHDTLFEVRAFGSDYSGHDLQIRIRELPGKNGPTGCVALP